MSLVSSPLIFKIAVSELWKQTAAVSVYLTKVGVADYMNQISANMLRKTTTILKNFVCSLLRIRKPYSCNPNQTLVQTNFSFCTVM